jgi:lipopolysaccharide/colanic/teichoic acid biosynthesis glycosyltransferase
VAAARWTSSRGKRCFDVVSATAALVVAAPVLLVAALAVRVRLGSPVLIRQQRAGRHGEPISVPKLRSMSDARDAQGALLPDEQRLDGFGRALRASSIDELPQLWSVVVGDMSVVGPRPLPLAYVPRYSAEQARRLDVSPGLTGWAQVHGRNTVSWPDRLAHDVWYVERASFALDMRIIWRTVGAVFSRRGVSADGHVTMPEFTGDQ